MGGMTSNVFVYQILIVLLKNVQYTIKHAGRWSTLIASLKSMNHSRKEVMVLMVTAALGLMGMEALDMKVLKMVMAVPVQPLNTNAREHLKLNATQPLVRFLPNIARREMKKFVRS